MAKRFKFILTLPGDIEVDSVVSIHNHMAWPNYSQADPVFYKGIFDTYEAAEKYASEFEIYKYTADGYDSQEEAEENAEIACQEYEIEEEGECPYQLETVEILNVRIEELGDF